METTKKLVEKCTAAHNDALVNPRPGYEEALVWLIRALSEYNIAYHEEFGSDVLDDYILGGEGVCAIARGARTLLNGNRGRLDGGAMDAMLLQFLPEKER